MTNIKDDIKDLKNWVHKSWTIWFNTLAGLVAIFADNVSQLSGIVEQKLYAALAIGVPMVNYILRAKTERAKRKQNEEL